MTIETLIKWAAGILFGGVAIMDILLVVACGKNGARPAAEEEQVKCIK